MIDNIPIRLKLENQSWKLALGYGYHFSIQKNTCIAKSKSRYDHCYLFRAISIVTMDFTLDRTENVLSYVHSIVYMGIAWKM